MTLPSLHKQLTPSQHCTSTVHCGQTTGIPSAEDLHCQPLPWRQRHLGIASNSRTDHKTDPVPASRLLHLRLGHLLQHCQLLGLQQRHGSSLMHVHRVSNLVCLPNLVFQVKLPLYPGPHVRHLITSQL